MTREEAISDIRDNIKPVAGGKSLDLAIKALEKEPCEDWCDVPSDEMTLEQARQAVRDLRKKLAEYLLQEPCEDCISRERTMLRVREFIGNTTYTEKMLVDDLNALPSVTPQQKLGHSFPEGATNKDIFKAIFGYEPATDSVVCNKEDWCGASEPCNYCINNSNNIGREEDWWNAPYKAESEE